MVKIKILITLFFLGLVSFLILNILSKNTQDNSVTAILIPGLGDKINANKFLSWYWQRQGVKIIIFDTKWKSDENYPDKFNRLLNLIDSQFENDKKLSLVGTSAGGSLALNAFNVRKDKINKVVTICSRLRLGQLTGFRGFNQRVKGYPAFAKSIIESENLEKTLSKDDRQKIMTVSAQFGDELVPQNTSTITGAHNIFVPTIEHAVSITSSLTIFSKPLIEFL